MRKISYLKEPTPLQCGQAVLAMVTGLSIEEIITRCGTERETTLANMRRVLFSAGFILDEMRSPVQTASELPALCLLSLETPRCWHWSLYCNGIFYDPEHGILQDFPESRRRYYWAITPPDDTAFL